MPYTASVFIFSGGVAVAAFVGFLALGYSADDAGEQALAKLILIPLLTAPISFIADIVAAYRARRNR
jgi:hypothetical protein